jgi:hypothetical protein
VFTPGGASTPSTDGFNEDWREAGSSIWASGRKPVKKARGTFEFKIPEATAKFLKHQVVAYVELLFMGRSEKTASLKDPPADYEPKKKCPFCNKRKQLLDVQADVLRDVHAN